MAGWHWLMAQPGWQAAQKSLYAFAMSTCTCQPRGSGRKGGRSDGARQRAHAARCVHGGTSTGIAADLAAAQHTCWIRAAGASHRCKQGATGLTSAAMRRENLARSPPHSSASACKGSGCLWVVSGGRRAADIECASWSHCTILPAPAAWEPSGSSRKCRPNWAESLSANEGVPGSASRHHPSQPTHLRVLLQAHQARRLERLLVGKGERLLPRLLHLQGAREGVRPV